MFNALANLWLPTNDSIKLFFQDQITRDDSEVARSPHQIFLLILNKEIFSAAEK